MKFDVIIGNPPYQLETGGAGRQAKPIYNLFVEQAKKLNPRFLSMIIPARWYAGGMSLDAFRSEMLTDKRISNLVDFPIASDVFPGVRIIGGICYFLWEREYSGACRVVSNLNNESTVSKRFLSEFDIFVRFNPAISILKKVQEKNLPNLSGQVSGVQPFGLPTTIRPKKSGNIILYANQSKGFFDKKDIKSGNELVGQYKVLLSMAYGEGGESREYPRMILGKPFVAEPPSACTMTYIVVGGYDNREEATNLASYLRTRFVRFLVGLRKNTQHITRDRFFFVPALPMNRAYSDEYLYEFFRLTKKEIEFIESMIRPMEVENE